MDKIKIMMGKDGWSLDEVGSKINELIEGYNELSARIDSIWAHRDRMRRMENDDG